MKLFYETRDMPFFVGDSYCAPFPAHVHNVIEVVYLMRGFGELMIGGKNYQINTGDTAVVFPTVPHAYIRFSEDARGMSMFFDSHTIAEFDSMLTQMRPEVPVLTCEEAGSELPKIAAKLYSISCSENKSLLRAYLHLFLAYVLPRFSLLPAGNECAGCVDRVINYIGENCLAPITLKSVSMALGLSTSHLSHLFIEQLNIGFRQYVNTLRIDYAKRLLRDPSVSVTEVCYKCGYENLRTFNRAFLAECGDTPSRFRARSCE